MFDLPTLVAHLLELGVLVLVSIIAASVGYRIVRLFAPGALSVGERLLFSLALGYGLLSFIMLGTGLLGLLYTPVALAVLSLLAVLAAEPCYTLAREAMPALRRALG